MMSMLSPPFLENEEQRLKVSMLSDDRASPVPRDERFDRITRSAMRLLEAPYAFLAINGDDGPELCSAQGLPPHQTGHALAFCDEQILNDQVLMVPDTSANPLFWHNPLVTGTARVRSFLSMPLARAPGTQGATLCAMHNEPRAFSGSHVLALQDLARIAESELKLDALAAMHKRVVARLDQMERRAHFDTVTGCWSVRRFREILAAAVAEAHAKGGDLALCYVRVGNFKALAGSDRMRQDSLRQCLAQELRSRLPPQGALASLGGCDFCAMLPGPQTDIVEKRIAAFTAPHLAMDLAGIQAAPALAFGRVRLGELGPACTATEVWARALANLEH
jgi:GGDEF domain-containing protein